MTKFTEAVCYSGKMTSKVKAIAKNRTASEKPGLGRTSTILDVSLYPKLYRGRGPITGSEFGGVGEGGTCRLLLLPVLSVKIFLLCRLSVNLG